MIKKICLIFIFLICLVIPANSAPYVSIRHLKNFNLQASIFTFGVVISETPFVLSEDGSSKNSVEVISSHIPTIGQYVYTWGTYNKVDNKLYVSDIRIMKWHYPVVITLGDSITYSPETFIESFPDEYFSGLRGMNASKPTTDYVFLILDFLRRCSPENAIIHYSSQGAHQEGGKMIHVINNMPIYLNYIRTSNAFLGTGERVLVTLQIGENDNDLTLSQYRTQYTQILDSLISVKPQPRIFCWGIWAAKQTEYHSGTRAFDIDQIMKEECKKRKIPFYSIEDVWLNPLTWYPGGPINWHPNDVGMVGYADKFINKLKDEIKE